MDWISSDSEKHGMKRILHGTILLILGITIVETQFINEPPSTKTVCKNETVFFNWTYTTTTPALVVEWKVNGSRIALEDVGAGQSFTPVTSYASRLNKVTNAQISLGLVTPSDTGTYKCELTDVNGSPFQSNEITLTVYDVYDTPVQIQQTVVNEGETILKPVSSDSSINYTWSGEGRSESGVMFTVTTSGNYTLCISGGKATCLSQSLSPCTSLVVTVSGCTGAFYCACPILIAVVSTIIICILMWKEVTKKIGGFSNEEIKIIVIFSVVAISVIPIGLGLGLGLREGTEKCLNCEVTIGISIALGIVLSLVQFSFVYYWNHKKGPIAKDSKGSPTSASEVKVQTEKSSHSNSAEKSTDLKKPLPRPLPIPMGRNNQLEPLQKPDNGEVERSAPEKKKKKKKKRKREEASVENEEEN